MRWHRLLQRPLDVRQGSRSLKIRKTLKQSFLFVLIHSLRPTHHLQSSFHTVIANAPFQAASAHHFSLGLCSSSICMLARKCACPIVNWLVILAGRHHRGRGSAPDRSRAGGNRGRQLQRLVRGRYRPTGKLLPPLIRGLRPSFSSAVAVILQFALFPGFRSSCFLGVQRILHQTGGLGLDDHANICDTGLFPNALGRDSVRGCLHRCYFVSTVADRTNLPYESVDPHSLFNLSSRVRVP